MLSRPAVFLDLNGTMVMPVQAGSPADFRVISGVSRAVVLLNSLGFVCPVVTAQSRIAKGVYSEAQFRSWFESFKAELASSGAEIIGPYLCPHSFHEECACRKPKSELYLRAASDLDIVLDASYGIGDTKADVIGARSLGAVGCLVLTGWGHANEEAAPIWPDLSVTTCRRWPGGLQRSARAVQQLAMPSPGRPQLIAAKRSSKA